MALKRGRRVNCLFLPIGVVSRAKTGGGYGKTKRRLQKVTGEGQRSVFILSSHSSWGGEGEGPAFRMIRHHVGEELNSGIM